MEELQRQSQVIDDLVGVAMRLKSNTASKEERLVALRQDLANLRLPPTFRLPLDPKYEVSALVPEVPTSLTAGV